MLSLLGLALCGYTKALAEDYQVQWNLFIQFCVCSLSQYFSSPGVLHSISRRVCVCTHFNLLRFTQAWLQWREWVDIWDLFHLLLTLSSSTAWMQALNPSQNSLSFPLNGKKKSSEKYLFGIIYLNLLKAQWENASREM